ncbi:hypothetical protein GF374_02780 [Candidatus Woesearchaeota archaeon]|nr:hypothetical protein [Candidatus Woesearchaeota archaeon]
MSSKYSQLEGIVDGINEYSVVLLVEYPNKSTVKQRIEINISEDYEVEERVTDSIKKEDIILLKRRMITKRKYPNIMHPEDEIKVDVYLEQRNGNIKQYTSLGETIMNVGDFYGS